ncbi:MAG TPA: hypothetical protein VM328_06765, partial [Fimbriimonadaceae bacterium]|nr:hypothetical protein [Fimbriimonadaceae bacterium]
TVESLLQYERPSKIYLRQVRKSSDPFTYVLSSDGKHFTYDAPDSNLKFAKSNRDRIQESIEVPQADPTAAPVRLNIGDMYAAAAFSLGDRSAPFDIAIGRIEDLRFLTGQWPALSYQGITELRGERVHVIHGHWRPSDAVERATGQFELYISETFDLRRYVVRERAQLAARSEIAIVSDWSVNLLVGGKPDPNLFKLVL